MIPGKILSQCAKQADCQASKQAGRHRQVSIKGFWVWGNFKGELVYFAQPGCVHTWHCCCPLAVQYVARKPEKRRPKPSYPFCFSTLTWRKKKWALHKKMKGNAYEWFPFYLISGKKDREYRDCKEMGMYAWVHWVGCQAVFVAVLRLALLLLAWVHQIS